MDLGSLAGGVSRGVQGCGSVRQRKRRPVQLQLRRGTLTTAGLKRNGVQNSKRNVGRNKSRNTTRNAVRNALPIPAALAQAGVVGHTCETSMESTEAATEIPWRLQAYS